MSRVSFSSYAMALVLGSLPSTLEAQTAQQEDQGEFAPVARVNACRSVESDADRLDCFDREVARLNMAVDNNELQIVRRSDLAEVHHERFGFETSNSNVSSDSEARKDEPEEISGVEGPLVAFGISSAGKAYFTIEGGMQWMQTDNRPVLGDPEMGELVKIERAALGSYKASIGSRRAIRVRRIQ